MKKVLGIDIGGSGVKGAIVDIKTGKFLTERLRVPTPKPYSLEGLLDAIDEIIKTFNWNGVVGCGFPGVVRQQIIETALNLGSPFYGVNLAEEIGRRSACNAWVINDADAAGIGEMRFGAGKNQNGSVLMLTVGTGIGSALFTNGNLVPNLEFGSIKMKDKKSGKMVLAETLCSDAARKRLDLKWEVWAERFNKYLNYIQSLINPDLIILGGGISSKPEKFFDYLDVKCDLVLASLENRAGIAGAAFEAGKRIS
ncbi:polyphosphate--glucose phosphotransferase [Intestinicryptomonas porci]|uniref:ROK family protein n=1 Tax=Intestinicryptomonas porci TaxID=2926320 RepID=A0ABU4WEH3_9BACT|nr:ROK family protein [Opitutales bacterium CLA-KB-P66]